MTGARVSPGPPGLVAERVAAQLLSGPPAPSAAAVAGRLLAIQAQDLRAARLAIRARSRGLTAADVDRALTADRTLVTGWLNRGTLHLVRTEDYWPLHQLTTPQLHPGNARRLSQEGVPPEAADRGVTIIEQSLSTDGPQTRAQLAERLSAAGIRTEGQALVHVIVRAALRGIAVRGPVIGQEQAYVLARDWVGAPPPAAGASRALGWLARRYLAGHAPASAADLARWAGLPLREARRGFAEIAAGLAERADGLAALARPPGSAAGAGSPALPPARLLGAFDPLLHGWVSRAPVLGDHEPDIVRGGMFRPFALVRGRAVGTWGLPGGQVELAPLEPLGAADRAALDADAADVRRFLGLGPVAE